MTNEADVNCESSHSAYLEHTAEISVPGACLPRRAPEHAVCLRVNCWRRYASFARASFPRCSAFKMFGFWVFSFWMFWIQLEDVQLLGCSWFTVNWHHQREIPGHNTTLICKTVRISKLVIPLWDSKLFQLWNSIWGSTLGFALETFKLKALTDCLLEHLDADSVWTLL